MSFGSRLTAARKEKHLTQEALGKGLGTDGKDASKAVVYGWEKDQHYPRVDQLVLICNKLECSADYLLFGKAAQASAVNPEVASLSVLVDRLPEYQRGKVLDMIRDALEIAGAVPPQSGNNIPVQKAGNG